MFFFVQIRLFILSWLLSHSFLSPPFQFRDLGVNSLSGTIPSEFQRLNQLTTLCVFLIFLFYCCFFWVVLFIYLFICLLFCCCWGGHFVGQKMEAQTHHFNLSGSPSDWLVFGPDLLSTNEKQFFSSLLFSLFCSLFCQCLLEWAHFFSTFHLQ